jgi:hypothetical protein
MDKLHRQWLDFSWAVRFAILSAFFGATEGALLLIKSELSNSWFSYIAFFLMIVSATVKAVSAVFAAQEAKTEQTRKE